MSAVSSRRPLTVIYLGGRSLGYCHLFKPPPEIRKLRTGLLDVLADEFEVDLQPSHCAAESPIQRVLSLVVVSLSLLKPREVLVLHGVPTMFDTIDCLVAGQEDFAYSAITLVGTKYLLGSEGIYGDPDGSIARAAIRNAMKGGLRAPGIYVASGKEAIPWDKAELVLELRAKK
jgi:hypothetical protein